MSTTQVLIVNPVLKSQNDLYKKLLKLKNKSNSELFTFWLTKRINKGFCYRFNRGGDPKNPSKGYTDVGIVKIGSTSMLQFAGFHFTKGFTQCTFRIENRPANDLIFFAGEANKMKIKAPTLGELTSFISTVQSINFPPLSNYKPFDSTLLTHARAARSC